MLATSVAVAGAQEFQIVKVASVAGSAVDQLKPRRSSSTTIGVDETTDKGAFIRFDEWSRTKPVQRQFLSLFPSFTEGMVHRIIDGTRKEVKDELQMYITEARFKLSRPAARSICKRYATLPFIQSIDPAIKHELIKPSDVSIAEGRAVVQQQEPGPAWCEGPGVTGLHPLDLQARRQAADRRRARQQAARQREGSFPTRSSSRARCGC